ncbi:TerD family protein [Streptomyces sp. NPDC006553]|uniref:TerD family protein n=1 Tax=unclassified Streptomyces TaxID=2593676 RepID=UPI00224E001C|nr:TerD family protein [Streptomyces sp. NBC_00233]MCX5226122.1 TerD family protein [Streptomyces sp. NBC_00233]
MTKIVKGGNLPVPGQVWRIAVVRRAAGGEVPEVDTSALLLDAAGRVGDDGDLVFYNQLTHPSGAVRLLGRVSIEDDQVADWLEIDPARVEPDIQRIAITASCDDGTFGRVPGLLVRTISAGTGEQLALYEVEDATTETAFVLGEFYRRDGAWKFRAVGQGYDSGLVGLAEDFGIEGRDPDGQPEPEALPVEALAKVPAADAPVPAQYPVTPQGPVPAQASASAQAPAPAAVPAQVPVPGRVHTGPPSAGLFGGDFPEFVRQGRGKLDVTVDVSLPPGFVLVDTERKGDGHFVVYANGDLVANTNLEDFQGRAVFWYKGPKPLRLRVQGLSREWTVAVRPVSVVEELGHGARGRGADVLLHTGPAGELLARLSPEDGQALFQVWGYEPGARDTHLLASEVSRRPKSSRPLPAGPLLVAVGASEGDWTLEVRPPKGNGSGRFWRRR